MYAYADLITSGTQAEAGCYGEQVDAVELVRVLPRVFRVVDFETAVGQDEGGLDRRESSADYGGGGVLDCEFDGLDSGAGGDVENVVDAAGEVLYWGEVEAPVEGYGKRWCGRPNLSCSSREF